MMGGPKVLIPVLISLGICSMFLGLSIKKIIEFATVAKPIALIESKSVIDAREETLMLQNLTSRNSTHESDNKITLEQNEKYLIVETQFGLSNQQRMIQEAILVAQATNRNLVLPRPRIRIPSSFRHATSDVPTSPFEDLWDPAHFTKCARKLFNVRVVDSNVSSAFPDKNWTFYRKEDWGLKADKPYNVIIQESGVDVLKNETSAVVELANPFWLLIDLKDTQDCFVESQSIQEKSQKYFQQISGDFVCLHARIEADWFDYCCGDGSATNVQPDQWRCGNGGLPERPFMEQADTKCYMSASEIANTLIKEKGLTENQTLWVASGGSDEQLLPVLKHFRVFRQEKLDSKYFMDYSRALIDRLTCSKAREAWVNVGSSFPWYLKGKVPLKYYNRRNS